MFFGPGCSNSRVEYKFQTRDKISIELKKKKKKKKKKTTHVICLKCCWKGRKTEGQSSIFRLHALPDWEPFLQGRQLQHNRFFFSFFFIFFFFYFFFSSLVGEYFPQRSISLKKEVAVSDR